MTSTAALNEKDMLSDILVLEKDIVKSYGHYMVEASCEKLRNVLNKNLKDAAGDQFAVFDEMAARNYYPVKEAQSQEIRQAKTQFDAISRNLS